MRIDDNGTYRDMTPEEIKAMEEAMEKLPHPVLSNSERITKLETGLKALDSSIRHIMEVIKNVSN